MPQSVKVRLASRAEKALHKHNKFRQVRSRNVNVVAVIYTTFKPLAENS